MSDYTPTEYDMCEAWKDSTSMLGVDASAAVFDRFINKIKADAWGEGQEAGWDDAQQQWSFTGMVGDFYKHSSTTTPYRIEGEAS